MESYILGTLTELAEPEKMLLTTRGTESIPRIMTMKNGASARTWPMLRVPFAPAMGRLIKKDVRTELKHAQTRG
jgi:hypothetical protein